MNIIFKVLQGSPLSHDTQSTDTKTRAISTPTVPSSTKNFSSSSVLRAGIRNPSTHSQSPQSVPSSPHLSPNVSGERRHSGSWTTERIPHSNSLHPLGSSRLVGHSNQRNRPLTGKEQRYDLCRVVQLFFVHWLFCGTSYGALLRLQR